MLFGLQNYATAKTFETITEIPSVEIQEKYKKIEASEISQDALRQIGTKYGGYAIKEAYVGEDGSYKLVLSKDDTVTTVYFTAAGEFIKEGK